MLPGGLVSGGGGGGGGLCLLRWLGLRLWSRRGTLVFALLWFGSWLFLNGLVLVHRTILSDYCTDDKSKRILQRLGICSPSLSVHLLHALRGEKGSQLTINMKSKTNQYVIIIS
ncbi:hypothetical protein EPR50_G00227800 [Perca flavescens]|uniref:Uncharacterized protein n=1 Tax=Perca flavescens TaxID=8167 RepID=A0A484C181_PERFV|nr:hypothetical protein EPR50_G00227800 [Perca flavescens]